MRLRKGSPEAMAWAARMKKARALKIRSVGKLREAQYFGPGGHLGPARKPQRARRYNPSPRYDIGCTANGCTFLRQGLTKKQANQQGCSHANAYGHSVSVVLSGPMKKNPGRAYHVKEAREAHALSTRKDNTLLERAFYRGVEVCHGESARRSNPFYGPGGPSDYRTWHVTIGTAKNPRQLTKNIGGYFVIVQKEARRWRVLAQDREGQISSLNEFMTLPEALNFAERIGHRKNPLAVFSVANPRRRRPSPARRRKSKPGEMRFPMSKLFAGKKYKRNPPKRITANVEGVVYDDVHEVFAEKTGAHDLQGTYRHPFNRGSKVKMLALDNGGLLLQSSAGKKLWREH